MSVTKTITTLYNPAEKSKADLIREFVVRTEQFGDIFRSVKEADPRHPDEHFLILGQRGMGKTTLLFRIRYAVEDDPKLSKWLIPVSFSEELYGIGDLANLWEYIAAYLEDNHTGFEELKDSIELHLEDQDYRNLAYKLLIQALKKTNKHLLLLIDNFQDLIRKWEELEARNLRQILISEPRIRLIAGSPVILEANLDYENPFYDFFHEIRLKGLTREESLRLLKELAGKTKEQAEYLKKIDQNSKRIEALRRLSGGVVRTMLLLFEIFMDNETGEAFEDLNLILDRVTPLYKARMDDLKPQQQRIVDAVAKAWDAIPASDIATKVRIPSNKVSAQLKHLIENQIIQKIDTETRYNLYQIQERFFNIWYLMRHAGKNTQAKIKWLVRFLEEWCDEDELIEKTEAHIAGLKRGEYKPDPAYLITEALSATDMMPVELRDELLRQAEHFLSQKDQDYQLPKKFEENNSQSRNLYDSLFPEDGRPTKETLKAPSKIQSFFRLPSLKILLNQSEEAFFFTNELLLNPNLKFYFWDSIHPDITTFLTILLAKQQHHTLLKLFKDPDLQLKDKYKPIYYALMRRMKDDFPNEHLKAGAELHETIQEVLDKADVIAEQFP